MQEPRFAKGGIRKCLQGHLRKDAHAHPVELENPGWGPGCGVLEMVAKEVRIWGSSHVRGGLILFCEGFSD